MVFQPTSVQYLQDEYSKIVQGKRVSMLSRMMSLNFMMHLLLNCSMRNISSKMERKSSCKYDLKWQYQVQSNII